MFEGLTPGLRYELRVRTTSGGLSSEARTSGRTGECSQCRICLSGSTSVPESQLHPISAPQPVSALSMIPINNGKILKVSWAPPSGYWESYNIMLRSGSDVLVNQTVSKASTQLAFSSLAIGLVPGHLYEADVTVRSGSLGNTARCYGRLGQLTFAAYLYFTKQAVENKHLKHIF